MKYPIDTYRAFGDKCADAHYGKDVARATDLFAVLWSCLAEETAPDHGVARDVFNGAFRSAYLNRWRPAPIPAPTALDRSLGAGLNSRKTWAAPAPRYVKRDDRVARQVRSAALDCAAFYSAKSTA